MVTKQELLDWANRLKDDAEIAIGPGCISIIETNGMDSLYMGKAFAPKDEILPKKTVGGFLKNLIGKGNS